MVWVVRRTAFTDEFWIVKYDIVLVATLILYVLEAFPSIIFFLKSTTVLFCFRCALLSKADGWSGVVLCVFINTLDLDKNVRLIICNHILYWENQENHSLLYQSHHRCVIFSLILSVRLFNKVLIYNCTVKFCPMLRICLSWVFFFLLFYRYIIMRQKFTDSLNVCCIDNLELL